MRKKVIAIISIAVVSALLLTACKPKVKVGKYYLEGKNDVYIEVLNDKEIRFYGVDFSEMQKRWDSYGLNINLKEALSGVSIYYLNEGGDEINVHVTEVDVLPLSYIKAEKAIIFDRKVYKLRK